MSTTRSLFLILLVVSALTGCREPAPTPQIVQLEEPMAQTKTPSPEGPLDDSDLFLKSFQVPEGNADLAASVLRSLLDQGPDEPPLGRVNRGPGEQVIIVAPKGLHDGIVEFVNSLEAVEQTPKPATIQMRYWLVEAVAGQPGEGIPELDRVLEPISKAQGPTRFRLVDRVSLMSSEGERGQTSGGNLQVRQHVGRTGDSVFADLRIGTRRGPSIETRVQLQDGQTVVLGQVGSIAEEQAPEPEIVIEGENPNSPAPEEIRRRRRGMRRGGPEGPGTVLYVVQASVLPTE